MKVIIDMGHPLNQGASSSFANETTKNREVGNRLIAMLKEKGHSVVDVTYNGSNELYNRVNKANQYLNYDLYVSLHLNAYNGSAHGCETWVYSTHSKAYSIARRTNDRLCRDIGWYNRGVKTSTGLYVLKNTIMPSMLIEMGFVDNLSDMQKWNTEKICRAIYYGITGTEYIAPVTNNNSNSNNSKVIYRVAVNGKQIGAYSKVENVLNEVKKAIANGSSEIKITKK